jgi:hypothetical protein
MYSGAGAIASSVHGQRHPESGGTGMSEATPKANWEDSYEMEAEYDFSKGVPNPYAKLAAGRIVELEEDVHSMFQDSKAVNEALRLLIKTAKSVQKLSKAS